MFSIYVSMGLRVGLCKWMNVSTCQFVCSPPTLQLLNILGARYEQGLPLSAPRQRQVPVSAGALMGLGLGLLALWALVWVHLGCNRLQAEPRGLLPLAAYGLWGRGKSGVAHMTMYILYTQAYPCIHNAGIWFQNTSLILNTELQPHIYIYYPQQYCVFNMGFTLQTHRYIRDICCSGSILMFRLIISFV